METERHALIIAAHLPPYRVGSGYLRALKFCSYLPEFGWQPIVLAPDTRIFNDLELDYSTSSLLQCPVTRSFALDSARHLAIRGRYPDILAVPDRWVSWWLPAVFAGLRMIRRYRPKVLFSTYPIATAHLIGLSLSRLSGLPWVADFRDPMIDHHYPPPGLARRARAAIERATMRQAKAAVFTTRSTLDYYRERFLVEGQKLELIMNGYDEEDFAGIRPAEEADPTAREGQPLRLLHSGVLYPDVRDPTALFDALAMMKAAGEISSQTLRVVLRACGPEERYRLLCAQQGIDDIVEIAPGIPYHQALSEMCAVDGLLLLQGKDANRQVPAKLFEYLRAGTPIIGLLHPEGDTAQIVREADVGRMARIDDASEIVSVLREFVADPKERTAWRTPPQLAKRYSRRASAEALAAVLRRAAA